MYDRCQRCNRPLSNPESQARGMGPYCAGLKDSCNRGGYDGGSTSYGGSSPGSLSASSSSTWQGGEPSRDSARPTSLAPIPPREYDPLPWIRPSTPEDPQPAERPPVSGGSASSIEIGAIVIFVLMVVFAGPILWFLENIVPVLAVLAAAVVLCAFVSSFVSRPRR